MTAWIEVGSAAELTGGSHLNCDIDGYAVTIVRIADQLFAFEDRCTHDGEPLAGGQIEGTVVTCPRHGARFCLETGAALTPPAYEPLRLFKARQDAGRIFVAIP